MTDDATRRIEQQYEGQEHAFLIYQSTDIHFIYSFAWNMARVTWNALEADLQAKGWRRRRLHERSLDGRRSEAGPTYQPNLVTKTYVLERVSILSTKAIVVAPVAEYSWQAIGECLRIPVALECTTRLFDNGGGICTFVARLSPDSATFINVHAVLRLAANVDRGAQTEAEAETHRHLTASFLAVPLPGEPVCDHSLLPRDRSEAPTYDAGYVSLHDLFRRFLTKKFDWCPTNAPGLWLDSEVLDVENLHQDFQTPFIFTVAEVERSSFLRFRKHPTIDHAREVASIVCKLTLDNRYISRDYSHLSEDYIREVLPFSKKRNALVNLSLDRRLFFTTSRRGAIALSASLSDIPSFFVVPSFLNLLEILRVRWHLSNIVGVRLDRAIADLRLDSEEDPVRLLSDLYRWRAMFGAFLRDPIPNLFDGGSVTDVAEVAERQHWLPRLLIETERKLDCLERLVRDKLNIQRWEEMDLAPGEADEEPNVESEGGATD